MDKINKIYLVKRKDVCGYDEFDSMAVIAKDEKEAYLLTFKHSVDEDKEYWFLDNLIIELIGTSKFESQIVISSFNAG